MNALISVSDKTGIVEFASALHALGIKLLSTGGTAKLLADQGLPVTEVAELTGFPEMLDGRVKTLHPKVHGGLLARRDVPEHMAALKAHQIDTIDLLVVNLYPFEATVAKAGCTLEMRNRLIRINAPASLGGLPVLTLPVVLPSGLATGLQVVARRADSAVFRQVLAAVAGNR